MEIYNKIRELVEKDQEVRKKPSILAIHPEDYAWLYDKQKGCPIEVYGLKIMVNESVPVGGFYVGEFTR